MKKNFKIKASLFAFVCLFIVSCTETESTFEEPPVLSSITINANRISVNSGENVTFTTLSNIGTNVTNQAVFYINDMPITSNSYTFNTEGIFSVKSMYENITSNTIQITVQNQAVTPVQFVNRVLVEEYSGTWCGNCPRILYGTQLLKQQTDKEVAVQIHLFGNDPFITTQGNVLATSQNVSGVPTGRINRTISWNGPQYQNVAQVLNEIKPNSSVGLAINTTLASGHLNVNITLGFANASSQTRLVVYVVENNLFHTQANYSSNLYGGLSHIPNFEYDGVLRSVVTTGEAITSVVGQIQKNYTIPLPSNISNVANTKIVAFLVDANSNTVLNVRQANIEQTQTLETL